MDIGGGHLTAGLTLRQCRCEPGIFEGKLLPERCAPCQTLDYENCSSLHFHNTGDFSTPSPPFASLRDSLAPVSTWLYRLLTEGLQKASPRCDASLG